MSILIYDADWQQWSLKQQRLGLLGQLATAEQRAREVQLSVNVARLEGVNISGREEDALMRLARAQSENSKLQQQVAFGIFDTGRQAENARLILQTLWDDGTITNAEQAGAAAAVYAKRIREAGEAAAVARSPYEQLTRVMLESSNTTKQIDIALTSSLGNFENAFVDAITGVKSFGAAFKSVIDGIIKDLARLVFRQGITAPLANALLGGLGLGGAGPSIGNGLLPPPGTAGIPIVAHTGGVIGHGSFMRRRANPAAFRGAHRFRTGGIAGIGPDEVPIIAHKNEEILRRDDPRHRFNRGAGGSTSVSVGGSTIIIQGDASERTAQMIAQAQEQNNKQMTERVAAAITDIRRRNSSMRV